MSKHCPTISRPLSIREQALGKTHPDYASSLNNLALLYQSMGQYEKVLPYYQQALSIREASFWEDPSPSMPNPSTIWGMCIGVWANMKMPYPTFSRP